jgi:membrane-associated PAP2 superfamily phosphatase
MPKPSPPAAGMANTHASTVANSAVKTAQHTARLAPFAVGLLVLCAAALLWDATGWDMALAQRFGNAQGFALRHSPALQWWFHDAAQNSARALFVGMVAMVWLPKRWSFGLFKHIGRADRAHLALAALLAALLVVLIKQLSPTSCPYDLADFGGAGRYIGHWTAWFNAATGGAADGGGGRCFPGGHSSSGFAFVASAIVLLPNSRRWALGVFIAASAAGLALGWVQQLRGAHFISHAFWAWAVCWAAGLCYAAALRQWRARRSAS